MTPLQDIRIPAAVDAALYAQVPENCRTEALARTAWLTIRGALPQEAFEAALRGMRDDEMVQESLASWEAVHAACSAWPRGGRLSDATPVEGAFALALAMDGEVAAALELDEDAAERAERLRPLCPSGRVLETALAWVARRAAELAPLRAAEAPAEWEEAEEPYESETDPGTPPPSRPWLWRDPDPWGFADD